MAPVPSAGSVTRHQVSPARGWRCFSTLRSASAMVKTLTGGVRGFVTGQESCRVRGTTFGWTHKAPCSPSWCVPPSRRTATAGACSSGGRPSHGCGASGPIKTIWARDPLGSRDVSHHVGTDPPRFRQLRRYAPDATRPTRHPTWATRRDSRWCPSTGWSSARAPGWGVRVGSAKTTNG